VNSKSFGTTISPWIITLDALSAFAIPPRQRESSPGPQFVNTTSCTRNYRLELQADIIVNGVATTVCNSRLDMMYWNFSDMIVHQTSNGCKMNTGDLLGTGTISGAVDESHGCLLEMTAGGKTAFKLTGGEQRIYLEDGDFVRLSGSFGDGVGFGSCLGFVLPAHPEHLQERRWHMDT
jgi:fumarylacetoacetase